MTTHRRTTSALRSTSVSWSSNCTRWSLLKTRHCKPICKTLLERPMEASTLQERSSNRTMTWLSSRSKANSIATKSSSLSGSSCHQASTSQSTNQKTRIRRKDAKTGTNSRLGFKTCATVMKPKRSRLTSGNSKIVEITTCWQQHTQLWRTSNRRHLSK